MRMHHFVISAAWVMSACVAQAEPQVGEKAPLFQTLNDKMQPVDMAAMSKDKPLVVLVGSAS